ncbi:hypothetical protein F2P81_021848, partial [Scophthalmus maximus]
KSVMYLQLGELVFQQCWDGGPECRAEVHKQDPGIGSWRVQVLEDEVESHVYSMVYRPVSTVEIVSGIGLDEDHEIWLQARKGCGNLEITGEILPNKRTRALMSEEAKEDSDRNQVALKQPLIEVGSVKRHAKLQFSFNTIIPSKLITKLCDLGINTSLCNWILDFLTNRPQSVRLGNHTSSTLILNTGVPQGCVLSPLHYSLFTYDFTPVHGSNTIVKFADNTTVVGLISNNDEWCTDNNLALRTNNTKELIVDFRKKGGTHTPVSTEVEHVSSFKFLGVHISEDLSWTLNTSTLVKKAHQRLFFLRRLKKAHLSPQILVNFYRCTIESILTNCISVCLSNKYFTFNCRVFD